MKIIDLDDKSTWEEHYSKFLNGDSVWSYIKDIMTSDDESEKNNIFAEIENSTEYIKTEEIKAFRDRATDYLKRSFTHIIAYHACRPTDISSYQKRGIIPANTKDLIDKAKALFGEEDAVEKAVQDMGNSYCDHGSGKVGFFISRTGALEPGYDQYLTHGSEFFRCIASRLGEWAEKKLLSQGKPTIVRFAVPIEWMDAFTTYPMLNLYSVEPIRQLMICIHGAEKANYTIRGANLLTRPVPPKLILEYIDVSGKMKNAYKS